jgi:hypothetical protein
MRRPLALIPQQRDVIGEPAETAKHDVFIARQAFARAKCGLPFPLQNRNVAKHVRIEFLGQLSRQFLGGTHGIPNTTKSPAASKAGRLKAL